MKTINLNDVELVEKLVGMSVNASAREEILRRVEMNGVTRQEGEMIILRIISIAKEMHDIDLDLMSQSGRMKGLSLLYREAMQLLLEKMGGVKLADVAAN